MVRQDVKAVDRTKVKPFYGGAGSAGPRSRTKEMDFNAVREEDRKEQAQVTEAKEQANSNGSGPRIPVQGHGAGAQGLPGEDGPDGDQSLRKAGVVPPPPTPIAGQGAPRRHRQGAERSAGQRLANVMTGPRVRARTHIEKLDHLLGRCGVPSGHLVLVTGAPGHHEDHPHVHDALLTPPSATGTTVCTCPLEQSREAIIKQMARMDMRASEVEDRPSMLVDMIALRKAMVNEPGDWRVHSAEVRSEHQCRQKAQHDGPRLPGSVPFPCTSGRLTRRDMKHLFDWFKELNITVFLIRENWTIETQEAYLADGVIELNMKERDDLKVQQRALHARRRCGPGERGHALPCHIPHDGRKFVLTLPIVQMDRGVHS
ncbi:MAG: hypothetical protein MZV70_01335 [Desulfobacterales bacterium]|nr:hypothetical protein [Desulfobacterales bacterium]